VFSAQRKACALQLGAKLLLTKDYWALGDIREEDLRNAKRTLGESLGADALDAALCSAGVFSRTPLRGIARSKSPKPGPSIDTYVGLFRVPEQFREVTLLYVRQYNARVSARYSTVRAKIQGLARFWIFIDEVYPHLRSSADIRPEHTKSFIPHREAQAQANAKRGLSGQTDRRTTLSHDLATIRTFFTDIARWSLEEGSVFLGHVPPAPPLSFRDTQSPEIARAYRMREAAMTRRVIDLEREMPRIRALASETWREARAAAETAACTRATARAENTAFWDWALLELLVQSGLRIEEACNLTVFDILRRRDGEGRTYFLMHVAPSKFDRARLIPIGDALGKVLSEIIRRVKRFYGLDHVPPVDNFDIHERKPLPRAPYLLQGRTRPNMIGRTTMREMLAGLSRRAGAQTHDGQPLIVAPHDCRRVFASEHLNNGMPPHVLRELLGHERLDTVMIYAKLYPGALVEAYRRHVRGVYQSVHGPEVLKAPTIEEWDAFARSCDMRDMGTHLCALPAGEHCPRGLVCLGCVHAQPKKSAMPVFERMRASHARQLDRAERRREPLGQLAARRLELSRIEQALRRTQELAADVATAMEEALER
jgi:integrase